MKRLVARVPIALAIGATMLVPKADAQTTPISTCGFTADHPGFYQVTQNLAFTTSDCITISADDVTLDLGGFEISGNGSRAAINVTPTDMNPDRGKQARTVVRNGAVTCGPPLTASSAGVFNISGIVEGLRVTFCGIGISMLAAGVVRDNTATFNNIGIDVTDGIVIGNLVTNNMGLPITPGTASINGTGIHVSGQAVIKDNNASDNRIGITVIDPVGGSTLIGNIANNNTETGLRVFCPSNVTDNTFVNNGVKNIDPSSADCHIEDTVAP